MHPFRPIFFGLVVALAGLLLSCLTALAGEPAYRPGELLVKFKPQSLSATRWNLQRAARVRASCNLGRSRIQRLILEPGTTVARALAIYTNDPEVVFVEPNYIINAQSLPNDTHFNNQWGLYNTGQVVNGYIGTAGVDMDLAQAWQITTGRVEVVVAVADTGCDYRHPDLAANIWTNSIEASGISGVDDDDNGLVDDLHGWDFADGDNAPMDTTGHGTHVAGIIAAEGDNGIGVTGVAWQVRIMPLRFMDALDQGTTADAIAAIEYAIDQGVQIINCSWGGNGYSRALEDVMTNANALFICAAGNEGLNTDERSYYPAGFNSPNVLSVAASDQMDNLAGFSNYGTASVDVAAPGIRIYGLQNGRQTLWQESFDGAEMTNWTTAGVGNAWAVADPPYTQNLPALAINPQSNYTNNANTWARAPVQDLSRASASQLTFQVIGRSEAEADNLYLEVSTDLDSWRPLALETGSAITDGGISGTMPYWMPVKADLGPWDGQDQVYIRLRFQSDQANTDTGFYIDDITLSASQADEKYQFMQGTSMAAGFVSGLAALIRSQDLSLLPVDLKTIIENSVDLDQGLLAQTATGGRVNAFNALTLLSELSLSADTASADRIQLWWNAQTSINSQVIIQRRTDGQTAFETVARVGTDTTGYEDSDLAPNSTYYYRIQAEIEDGRSGYSNQTLATTLEQSVSSEIGGSSGGGGGCFVGAVFQ